MLTNWIRVFFSDNGVLTDRSLEAQHNNGSIPFDVDPDQDHIYVGQYFPFNSLYLGMESVNAIASTLSLQYWQGSKWLDFVDIIDATSVGAAALAQNGVVQYEPDRKDNWNRVDDTSEDTMTELETITVYNLYWLRFVPSAVPTLGTAFSDISYIFTEDRILDAVDPDVERFKANWSSGKTDWKEQIIIASNAIVLDLRKKGVIKSPGNLLRYDDLAIPAAYYTLHVIYNGLGRSYKEKSDDALAKYNELMGGQRLTVDIDNNARTDPDEVSSRVRIATR